MNEMIERVAKAIGDTKESTLMPWEFQPNEFKTRCRIEAIAAIKAMPIDRRTISRVIGNAYDFEENGEPIWFFNLFGKGLDFDGEFKYEGKIVTVGTVFELFLGDVVKVTFPTPVALKP